MSKLTKEEVKHVADLARLAITDEEAGKFAVHLQKIQAYIEELNELDTTNVQPTTHVLSITNVFREDVAEKGLEREKMLLNVKDHEDGQIKVPQIIEE